MELGTSCLLLEPFSQPLTSNTASVGSSYVITRLSMADYSSKYRRVLINLIGTETCVQLKCDWNSKHTAIEMHIHVCVHFLLLHVVIIISSCLQGSTSL